MKKYFDLAPGEVRPPFGIDDLRRKVALFKGVKATNNPEGWMWQNDYDTEGDYRIMRINGEIVGQRRVGDGEVWENIDD